MAPERTVDPFAATTAGERAAAYAALAAGGAVVRTTMPSGGPAWLVTRYAEARAVLNDPRLVKASTPVGMLIRKLRPELLPAIGSHMLLADGADHARLRRLVGAAFTRGRMEALEPRLREIAAELADGLAGGAPDDVVDLIPAYAYPLPMTAICELLGVPHEQRERFRLANEAVMAAGFIPEDQFAAGLDSLIEVVREMLAAKRVAPADDLLSALVAVREGGDRLSEDELTSMTFLLVAAGHETTVNLIGNAVAVVLARPGEWQRLGRDPGALPAAVEELLRWAGPVQVTFPVRATEAMEVGGVQVEAGDVVIPALWPANRDPDQVEKPGELNLGRTSNHHLAFGHGIHHCLGAPLARLEARVALQTLLERFGDLSLAVGPDELTYRPNFLFHALTALPVRPGKPT